jgi:hypothetical protein
MTIEEILKNAGIDDAEAIAKVKAEMPKAFLPLADHNKRIAAAKQEAADVQKAFDDFKAEAEAAAKANEGKEDEGAKALADLQAKYDKLEGDFKASQDKHRQRKATDALTKALKEAGANDAALSLLAGAGLAQIEYGEDGEPSNIADVAEKIKGDNAGLFGEPFASGKPQGKANGDNDPEDPFLKGFGKLD